MRLATSSDLPLILEALVRHKPVLEERSFVGTTDLGKAYSSLESEIGEGNGYVVGDFLVMVTELTPWYSNEKLLTEWFTMSLIKLSRGANLLVPALEEIAKQRSCRAIVTGDTSGSLSPVWVRGNMEQYGQSFYKKV